MVIGSWMYPMKIQQMKDSNCIQKIWNSSSVYLSPTSHVQFPLNSSRKFDLNINNCNWRSNTVLEGLKGLFLDNSNHIDVWLSCDFFYSIGSYLHIGINKIYIYVQDVLPLNREGDKCQTCIHGVVSLQTSREHIPIFELIQRKLALSSQHYPRDRT